MKIFKYILSPEIDVDVLIPKNAKVLSCQAQKENICIWVLVDENNVAEHRRFRAITTGEYFENEGLDFISSVQLGWMVFHIFEVN